MENPASLILGINNIYKYHEKELYNSKIVFKINLVIILVLHLFMLYQLFYNNIIIDFFDHKFGYILFVFYLGYTYLPLDMVLVEFGIWKKSTLNTKFLNYTKQLLESSEKKYSKPNKITKLQDEVSSIAKKQNTFVEKIEFEPLKEFINKKILNIIGTTKSLKYGLTKVENGLLKEYNNHRDFVKNEFEPSRNLSKKNAKRTTTIEEKIFIREKIQFYCSLKDIKSLFLEYRKELFENLDVHNFIKYMLEGKGEMSENILFDDEINNIIAIMTLLKKEGKINYKISVLFRLSEPYLKLNIKARMFSNNIKNNKYCLTKDETEVQILKKITNLKII